jgi:glutamine synthetase
MMQKSNEVTLQSLQQRGVDKVQLGLTDVDGVLRGKYLALDKFAGVLADGGGFCDCVLGWDVTDKLYDDAKFTGWHTGFPDAKYRLVADTLRWPPATGVPFFLGEFAAADGSDHSICPRTLLRRVLHQASQQGIAVKLAFEYEFFVFNETPTSAQAKGYRNLVPLSPGNFGYSVLREAAGSELFTGLIDYATALDCPIEGLHTETGPGVWEAALHVTDALAAADRASLFKTFSKVFFQKRGLMATYMAKWSMQYPGQSGHCHLSFWDASGNSLFFDATASAGMGAVQRHALGGLRRYLPELIALLAPTVNSYTRLVKGAWAPTGYTWGIENRTTAVRVIPGTAKSQRLECRVPGADANPYLAAAAIIGAALLGVQQRLEPGDPVAGNAYDVADRLIASERFPATLRGAAERLGASQVAPSLFGDAFVEHYVTSRLWESREAERAVNSWQLERYFEII